MNVKAVAYFYANDGNGDWAMKSQVSAGLDRRTVQDVLTNRSEDELLTSGVAYSWRSVDFGACRSVDEKRR